VNGSSIFVCKSKVGEREVVINTWRHSDCALIVLVRCLYFCLNFKSYFIVICEEQKVLGSVIGYCFEKERKLPFIFSPLAFKSPVEAGRTIQIITLQQGALEAFTSD
jgi:hypothetical protein